MTTKSTRAKLPARLAVAVSGSGRSLVNFIEHSRNESPFAVTAVIASTPDCRGVAIAKEHGLPVFIGDFTKEAETTAASLREWLLALNIDWLVLAGFIKRFPVLEPWQHRLVNIHPALLPEFGGKAINEYDQTGKLLKTIKFSINAGNSTIYGPTLTMNTNGNFLIGTRLGQTVTELNMEGKEIRNWALDSKLHRIFSQHLRIIWPD
jgi:folate-dependent phosphoribosylglycinamide formyltransferase PurN